MIKFRFKSIVAVFICFMCVAGCTKYQLEQTCCEGTWHIPTQNFKRPSHFILHVPQAFTPNGDGVNDEFFPIGVGWKLDKLVIKKGIRTVYESTDRLDAFWDGGEEKDGQYRYFMTFRTTTNDVFEANGKVCVMRYGERDGRFYDIQKDRICECTTLDMLDSINGIVRQSVECPAKKNVPIDEGTSANDTI